MKTNNKIITIIALVFAYFLLKYLIPFGNYIIYPINLIVTFLHELGHGIGAIITGGKVIGVEINSDGSGFAITRGGIESIVLILGYVGSAILGNLLLYIGLRKPKLSEKIIYTLAGLMIFTSIFWFNSIFSSIILLIMAAGLIYLAYKTKFDSLILQFIGVVSVLYIIEDFNVGPSSDLYQFTKLFIFIPQSIWMIIWLLIVLIITGYNLKYIFKK